MSWYRSTGGIQFQLADLFVLLSFYFVDRNTMNHWQPSFSLGEFLFEPYFLVI
jgi:hypothetical protein